MARKSKYELSESDNINIENENDDITNVEVLEQEKKIDYDLPKKVEKEQNKLYKVISKKTLCYKDNKFSISLKKNKEYELNYLQYEKVKDYVDVM